MLDEKLKDKFKSYLLEKKRSHYTVLAYTKDLEQFFDFLRENQIKDVKKIKKETIEAFLSSLFKKKFLPKTVSRKINTLKTFFRFLVNELKVIPTSPAAEITHPRIPSKGPRFLSRLEYGALRDAVRDNPRTYAVIELMLQTGLRIGEVARLRLKDYKGKQLYIQAFESHDARTIPLNKNAQKALETYLKTRPEGNSNALFLTRKGTSLSIRNIRASINRAFAKAGIENATVSDIRHTFIAQQLLQGTPVIVVSRIVGHKRTETTSRYLDYLKNYDFQPKHLSEL